MKLFRPYFKCHSGFSIQSNSTLSNVLSIHSVHSPPCSPHPLSAHKYFRQIVIIVPFTFQISFICYRVSQQVLDKIIVFENHLKYRIFRFSILAFSNIFFGHTKKTSLLPLFERKLQVFKNSPKIDRFCHFN